MTPGAHLETLFLDAGGVLVEPDWARVSPLLARHGIGASPAALAAADAPAKRDLDRPGVIVTTDDRARSGMYYRAVLRRAGHPAEGHAADAAVESLLADNALYNLWSSVPAGVPAALDRLRASGLRLVVVSNADGKLLELFRDLDLERRFDHVLDSGRLGFEKPDPRIFRAALRRSGARPESTVHLGDFFEIDVVGARAAGLRAILVDPAGLHGDRDCDRVPSLAAFTEALLGPG